MNFRVILFCGIIFFVACTSAMPVDDSAKEDPVLAVFDQASRDDASATEGFAAMPAHVVAAMDTLNDFFKQYEPQDVQDALQEQSSTASKDGYAFGCYMAHGIEETWNGWLNGAKTAAEYNKNLQGKISAGMHCTNVAASHPGHWWLTPEVKCKHYGRDHTNHIQYCDWRQPLIIPDPNPVVSIEVEYIALCSATRHATASCATVHNVKSGMKANSLNQHQVTDYTSKARAQAEASWDKISAQAKGSASFSSKQVQDFRQSSRQTSTETSSTVSTECTTTNRRGRYSGCYVYQVVSDIKLASGKTIHQSDPSIHIQARPLTKFHFKIL